MIPGYENQPGASLTKRGSVTTDAPAFCENKYTDITGVADGIDFNTCGEFAYKCIPGSIETPTQCSTNDEYCLKLGI
jgi:hypothetical protein